MVRDMKIDIYANHKGIIKTNHNSVHHLIYKGQALDENTRIHTYNIPNHSKLFFMSKSAPMDIGTSSNSPLEEYIISPQTNSPCMSESATRYMSNRLNDSKESSEILLDIHRMMKEIHHKVMNSKHI